MSMEGNNPGLSHSCYSEHHGACKSFKRENIKGQRQKRAQDRSPKAHRERLATQIIVPVLYQ